MDRDLRLVMDRSSDEPLYMCIANAIVRDIRRGRLVAGTPMPGTRRLAATLGVHRNTTVAAYRELAGAGWIDTEPGRGTCITRRAMTPAASPATTRVTTTPYRLRSRAATTEEPRGDHTRMLALSHMPDPRLAPTVALARAYRRAMRQHRDVLDYANRRGSGMTFGHVRLREALAEMLNRTRGLVVDAANVLVTSGSQMALYLAALALVEPGDVIAVECMGYRPVWESLRLAGARVVPVPIDASGIDVDALRELASRLPLRAVYVTPAHQHPSGVALAPERRVALLDLASSAGFAVLEDDWDGDFDYDGERIEPLAALDRRGAVIHVGSLAKVLAPGIRIGYAVAPTAVLELMAERRCFIDRQGDHALDCAVSELLEDGELRRHVQRVRGIHRARRDALASALARELAGVVTFERPARGTAIWAHAPGMDVDAWHAAALLRGVSFSASREFDFADRPSRHARFGFAALDEDGLVEAVRRLAAAASDCAPRCVRAVRGDLCEPDLSRGRSYA
jgi:GntR family transcriptional regulator/MocR family aminotransferase